jgi:aryl-alcohol dehydrogenase-like predicted oxidoreductase
MMPVSEKEQGMEYRTLGRTGLHVSVMGLGGGGHSRLGMAKGKTESESISILKEGIDAGINFIDTAELYGTEPIVGKGIKGIDRDKIIISSKKLIRKGMRPNEVREGLEKSLKNLGTDYIDIYHLHGVAPEEYNFCVSEIYPEFREMKEKGLIRFIGITERFEKDYNHSMLQKGLHDDIWDVMMVGFNMLNQSARDLVFKNSIENNIGILNMFAVRRAFSNPERLSQIIMELIEKKQLSPDDIDKKHPLSFLIHAKGARSLTDAAYRFCRYEPGVQVVLSGTSNYDHLKANIESFSRPPLPEEDVAKIKEIFQKVDSVSGS